MLQFVSVDSRKLSLLVPCYIYERTDRWIAKPFCLPYDSFKSTVPSKRLHTSVIIIFRFVVLLLIMNIGYQLLFDDCGSTRLGYRLASNLPLRTRPRHAAKSMPHATHQTTSGSNMA